jgi:hypothetical protein
MNYHQKYLKYKSKYLQLKKLKYMQKGGNPFRVIRNTGQDPIGGLINQCMWISIRDFLRLNGYPEITTQEIRNTAGLAGLGLEHTMFDIENPIFSQAIQQISNVFNLRINIYPLEYSGELSHIWYVPGEIHPNPARIIESSDNTPVGAAARRDVHLSQYGIGHFELIVGGYHIPSIAGAVGQAFVPAVPIKGELKKVDTLSDKEIRTSRLYQHLFDLLEEKKLINKQILEITPIIEQNKGEYKSTLDSRELTEDIKKLIIESQKSELDRNEAYLISIRKRLEDIESEKVAIEEQIKEWEK